jgi:2-iminobutanoate/2-iminopropanoate deaminase
VRYLGKSWGILMSDSQKIEIHHPDKKVSTGAYSAGVLWDGWLFVSGQGPLDLASGEVLRGTVEEETRATLANIDKILRAAGCTSADVVKCTCHLSRIEDFDAFNSEYARYFQGIRPARTTVQSVLWGGIKVEIDCIARAPRP